MWQTNSEWLSSKVIMFLYSHFLWVFCCCTLHLRSKCSQIVKKSLRVSKCHLLGSPCLHGPWNAIQGRKCSPGMLHRPWPHTLPTHFPFGRMGARNTLSVCQLEVVLSTSIVLSVCLLLSFEVHRNFHFKFQVLCVFRTLKTYHRLVATHTKCFCAWQPNRTFKYRYASIFPIVGFYKAFRSS